MHRDASYAIPDAAAGHALLRPRARPGTRPSPPARSGYRNAQATVLAPTGTISFLMDCDTTGVEPDFSLVKFKELVGGGQMTIVNQTIPMALRTLGYAEEQIEQIEAHIDEHATIVGAPGLAAEHLSVFDVAVGERAISHMGHIKMMGAVQPFISGAISKCVAGDTLVASERGLVRIGALHNGESAGQLPGHGADDRVARRPAVHGCVLLRRHASRPRGPAALGPQGRRHRQPSAADMRGGRTGVAPAR